MQKLKYTLAICLLIFIISGISSCNRETIIVTEEVINEFLENEKVAIKKYKNKRLQVHAEISTISLPENWRQKKYAESIISLMEKDISFSFRFDYNVTSRYNLKGKSSYETMEESLNNNIPEMITIEGTLEYYNKRIITIYNHERTNPEERYWKEVELSFFSFDKSEIISLVH
jgi:hypothetical protein